MTGGYYTVKTTSGIRILALNTNLYYTSDKVTAGIADPADQFSWMENVLANSHASNEKVHYFSIYDLELTAMMYSPFLLSRFK